MWFVLPLPHLEQNTCKARILKKSPNRWTHESVIFDYKKHVTVTNFMTPKSKLTSFTYTPNSGNVTCFLPNISQPSHFPRPNKKYTPENLTWNLRIGGFGRCYFPKSLPFSGWKPFVLHPPSGAMGSCRWVTPWGAFAIAPASFAPALAFPALTVATPAHWILTARWFW